MIAPLPYRPSPRLRRAWLAAVLACAGLPAMAAEAVDLTIDFAKILKLERPAATVVVGNPGIADATIGDDRTIVLTGKAAGTTNLIVLDDSGTEISSVLLRVASNVRHLTTIYYGAKRQTFSCAPQCEQVISVGDDAAKFDAAKTQIEARQSFSTPK